MTNLVKQRYEFNMSSKYILQLKRQKLIAVLFILPIILVIFYSVNNLVETLWIALSVSLIHLFIFYLIIQSTFQNIKLFIDSTGITTNKLLFNLSLKSRLKWTKIISIIEIPAIDSLRIQLFPNLPVQSLENETIFIPTHIKQYPVPIPLSDKMWINSNISLGDAIRQCSNKTVLTLPAEEYQKNHAPFGSQIAFDKKTERLTYFSIFSLLLAGCLFFLDNLFTLDFGNIKTYVTYLAVILTTLTGISLFTANKAAELEEKISKLIVSILFGCSFSCLIFMLFIFFHTQVASAEQVTFTLEKVTEETQKYDKWVSEYGVINCKFSNLQSNTTFKLTVYNLLTVRRYKMSDICLADEKNNTINTE